MLWPFPFKVLMTHEKSANSGLAEFLKRGHPATPHGMNFVNQ